MFGGDQNGKTLSLYSVVISLSLLVLQMGWACPTSKGGCWCLVKAFSEIVIICDNCLPTVTGNRTNPTYESI